MGDRLFLLDTAKVTVTVVSNSLLVCSGVVDGVYEERGQCGWSLMVHVPVVHTGTPVGTRPIPEAVRFAAITPHCRAIGKGSRGRQFPDISEMLH